MKKFLYISVILNVLALLMISGGVSALSVSKEVQDLVGYVQSMIFTDSGTPDGNIKVRISGGELMIYGSGGIWIGKGGGNGIYSDGTNVGIGTTDLSNRLNVGGDVGVKNESKLKLGLNGNSYTQGTGNIINIISQGVVNMEGLRNYIRGGVVTFGSTWYDENDNSYFLDLNNNTKLSNLNTKGLVTISTAGNAELDLKSGSLGHWGIYHDTASEDLRFRNGGLNRLSIGKGGEIYTNNTILVDGSKNWKGNIFMSNVGGTGLISCSEGETLIWDGINNKWKCGEFPTVDKYPGCDTDDIVLSNGQVWSSCNVGSTKAYNGETFVPTCTGTTCATDPYSAYRDIIGGLYQWGRNDNVASSTVTYTLASAGTTANGVGHNLFIINTAQPRDWISVQNDDLWGGAGTDLNSGTYLSKGSPVSMKGPCAEGYHVPTVKEWCDAVKSISPSASCSASWINDPLISTTLKMPRTGRRSKDGYNTLDKNYGYPNTTDYLGCYRTSSINGDPAYAGSYGWWVGFSQLGAGLMGSGQKVTALPVRCVKN